MRNVPRIESAEVIVTCPGRNFVTLKIRTDQAISGVGDATLNGRELAVVACLQEHVIPCLVGRDAQRIEDTWQYFCRGVYRHRGPPALHFDLSALNFGIQEYMRHTEATDEVFPHAYRFADGMMHPGDEPGLGVDSDETLAAGYPHKHAYLPMNRLEGGTLLHW